MACQLARRHQLPHGVFAKTKPIWLDGCSEWPDEAIAMQRIFAKTKPIELPSLGAGLRAPEGSPPEWGSEGLSRRAGTDRPDRRSPSLIVGPGFKGTCAPRVHSGGRRPSVRHSCGVRRLAHSKRSTKRNKSRGSQKLSGSQSRPTFHRPSASPVFSGHDFDLRQQGAHAPRSPV